MFPFLRGKVPLVFTKNKGKVPKIFIFLEERFLGQMTYQGKVPNIYLFFEERFLGQMVWREERFLRRRAQI